MMSIYDLRGRLIKSLSTSASGPHILWDGHDKNGNPLSPGVYPFVLRGFGGQKKFTGNIVIIP